MVRANPVFSRLYKQLNEHQRRAVECIEGPVIVVAGPGTGKTQILTLRIAHILKQTDTPPDAILALTFTESGVAAMRRRLVSIIGPDAYRVGIFTFHGFCNEIIRRYPDAFPRIIGGEPVTEIEKIELLRGIISDSDFSHIKPFGNVFYYVRDLRGKISELKRESFTPDDLAHELEHMRATFFARDDLYHVSGRYAGRMKGAYETELKRLDRAGELLTVYRAYQAQLAARHLYDFDDMVVEVVHALERDEDLLLRVQEAYLYILADEHQDTNRAQNRLLECVASFHEQPNVFVVGDEKQAIYRFQGASLKNFLSFEQRYTSAERIVLTDAYRSGQLILDAAHAMMHHSATEDERRVRPPLVSCAGVVHASTALHRFQEPAAEEAWVADAIAARIGEGVEPSEIAVLYRTNSEAARWVRTLEDRGVAVSVESDQNALTDPDIRRFITYVESIARFGDDEALARMLHTPFVPCTPLDAYKVLRAARRARAPVADVMRDRTALRAAGVADVEGVRKLYRQLERFARHEGSVPEAVGEMVRESGFLRYALGSSRSVELIEKLAGLTRDIETLASGNSSYTLADLAAHIALLDAYDIPVNKEVRAAPRPGAVRLMTAHRSKGLEFDYVYIVNAADGVWGGRRTSELFALPTGAARGDDSDERRLMYVALTRARVSVNLTYAHERNGKAVLPTRFVEEIGETCITDVAHEEAHDHAADMMRPRAPASVSLAEQSFIRELFVEQGLSVTALNNYLACPWRYFYTNLIRIPIAPTRPLMYGSAIDRALKRYFDEYREHGTAHIERLLELFRESAARQPVVHTELDRTIARGEEHLRAWHGARADMFVRASLSGYRTECMLARGEGSVQQVLLRGEIDKIEKLSDGSARVIDYKTGTPKTRNAILGNTKNEDGAYFRQLVFYKLLLDLEGKYAFAEGVLDFIQPDSRGKLRRETFTIGEEDAAALRAQIGRVADEIWELSFWESRCDAHTRGDCEFCALRDDIEQR